MTARELLTIYKAQRELGLTPQQAERLVVRQVTEQVGFTNLHICLGSQACQECKRINAARTLLRATLNAVGDA